MLFGIGTEAAEEAEVLDQHPVRKADSPTMRDDRRAEQSRPPAARGQQARADRRQRDHGEQVHRESVRRGEGREAP